MTTAISVLNLSIKMLPSMKYAAGLAGIASVMVIVKSFDVDFRIAVFGTVVMLLLMTMLVVFAKLSELSSPDFRLPALVFTWFSLFLVIAVAFFMFLSVFFKWPVDMQVFIEPPSAVPKIVQNVNDAGDVIPPNLVPKVDSDPNETALQEDDCPEIVFADFSKNPPVYKKEKFCQPN